MANFYIFLKTNLVPFSGNTSSEMAKSTHSVTVSNYKVLDFMLDPIYLVQECHTTEAQGSAAGQAVETWGTCTKSCCIQTMSWMKLSCLN